MFTFLIALCKLDLFFKFLKDFEIDFKIKQALATFIN